MSIDFQKEKERIELKNSTYAGSIGIYMSFSERIEDATRNMFLIFMFMMTTLFYLIGIMN